MLNRYIFLFFFFSSYPNCTVGTLTHADRTDKPASEWRRNWEEKNEKRIHLKQTNKPIRRKNTFFENRADGRGVEAMCIERENSIGSICWPLEPFIIVMITCQTVCHVHEFVTQQSVDVRIWLTLRLQSATADTCHNIILKQKFAFCVCN